MLLAHITHYTPLEQLLSAVGLNAFWVVPIWLFVSLRPKRLDRTLRRWTKVVNSLTDAFAAVARCRKAFLKMRKEWRGR